MSTRSIGEGRKGRRYANTRDTAAYMGVSTALLEKSRVTGIPKIPYIKIGRAVRYDLDVIDQVMADWSRINTSEKGAA